jgi:hypothetical protein
MMPSSFLVVAAMLASLFIPSSSISAGQKKELDVAFSNGMNTDLQEAVEHLVYLISDLHRSGGRPQAGLDAILMYHVGSSAKNLQEVALQKALEVEDPEKVAAITRAHFTLLSQRPDFNSPYVKDLATAAADPVQDMRIRTISLLDVPQTVAKEASDDAAQLRLALKNREADLLLVSHSQGNLYSNLAVSALAPTLDDKQRIRLHVVGVGVPAAFIVLPDGARVKTNYMTSSWDAIIWGLKEYVKRGAPLVDVKKLVPPLKPNMSAVGDWPFGHGLETAYLARDSASNIFFISIVNCLLESMPPTCAPHSTHIKDTAPTRPANKYFQRAPSAYLNDDPPPFAKHPPHDYPRNDVEIALSRYPVEMRGKVRAFAQRLWEFWSAAAGASSYGDIQKQEYEMVVTEIQLLATMRTQFPSQSSDQVLIDVQSVLARSAEEFADYVRADRLASGHPLYIPVHKYVSDFEKL